MITRGRLLYEVAAWEFRRWFKLRDQVITLILSVVIGLVVWGGVTLVSRDRAGPVTVAVIGSDVLPFTLPEQSRIRLTPNDGRSERELRQAVTAEDLDGLLIIRNNTGATLLVREEPSWLPELQTSLTRERRGQTLTALDLSERDLAMVLAPYPIDVEYDDNVAGPTSRAAKVTAITIVVLMVFGVMLGLGLQFVAITGEKQLRVTEQIVSAISPQTWIDAKILGVSMVALVTLLTYALSILLFLAMSWLVGQDIPIPVGVVGPEVWLVLLPLGLAGFLFWNTFFAAVAATIDDPNTSARGSLMMLPILPVVLALVRLGSPDTALTQFLAIFPVTSPAFLPLRLMLTHVPLWEILAALILLVGSVAFMRRMAGKIFGAGILTYGKEPSWSEMIRWARSV